MPQPKSPSAKKAKGAPAKRSAPRKKTPAPAPEPAATVDQLPDGIATAIELLHRGVLLRRERLQEVVDDAVTRGRMTRGDAEDLVQSLMQSGRRQAEDLLSEVEKLVDRGRREVEGAARTARKRTAGSPVTREVDRARRKVGVPGFPILGYDELTAAQVVDRLADLDGPQLRKVRDYERRNANRKGVLGGIEKRLK
jgi:polyhydroxyalkanoate synthesis regulator phasin